MTEEDLKYNKMFDQFCDLESRKFKSLAEDIFGDLMRK